MIEIEEVLSKHLTTVLFFFSFLKCGASFTQPVNGVTSRGRSNDNSLAIAIVEYTTYC